MVEEPADLVEAVVRLLTGSRAARVGRRRPADGSRTAGADAVRDRPGCRETATDRLARMLALVPYIRSPPGVAIGGPGRRVRGHRRADRRRPGSADGLRAARYYPDDLIDVVLDDDGGTVSIAFDAGIERPVRLTVGRGAGADRRPARAGRTTRPGGCRGRALGAGQARRPAGGRRRRPTRSAWSPADRRTGAGHGPAGTRRVPPVWMQYYTASRDAVTERTVDPFRLLVTDGHAYLEALLPPGRRHPALPDRPDRRGHGSRRAAQGQLWVDSDIPERIFHPDPQIPPVTFGWPRRRAGWPSTTRSKTPGCRRRRSSRPVAGDDARPAVTTGWPGWCSRSAATP